MIGFNIQDLSKRIVLIPGVLVMNLLDPKNMESFIAPPKLKKAYFNYFFYLLFLLLGLKLIK
jgi:hypothetical protein